MQKHVKKSKVCRFAFPKFPMSSTQILQTFRNAEVEVMKLHKQNSAKIEQFIIGMKPGEDDISFDEFLQRLNMSEGLYILALRSSIKRDTVFLKREPNAMRVNNYNVDCLRAWRANLDVQVVLDIFSCVAYITAYVAKGARA